MFLLFILFSFIELRAKKSVIYGLKKNGVAPSGIINKETETIVATGVILAGIPCIDQIEIENIRDGDRIILDADNELVTIVK